MKKTATLFFVATAILTAEAEAATLKMSVASVDYRPGERVRIEVTVQGIAHLLGMYSRDITVRPESNDGVTACLNDGVVRWDIKRPEAEMSIPLTVSLPNTPGKKIALNFKGIAPDGGVTMKSYEIYTRQFNAVSPQTAALASVAAPRTTAPALNLDAAPEVANGGLLGKMRAETHAAWLHEFESYKDNGIPLGYPRSFTNVDGSVMTQLADSQWDFGLAGGMYRSPSAISKNPELLASFGRNVLRGGPVLRYRSNKNGNTVLETMVGINTGDQIQGTNYFSLSSKWEQKIGNPLFKQLGLGSVFPKRYALQNTVRGTLNGALESWSIQEQLDIPLPIFDAKGNISPLALSIGGTWNAIWDNGQKLPEKFRSSLDIYPWVGVTYHFGPNNQSGVTIAGAKGDDYKGGGETPIGLLTTGTLVLEGGDREIKNVDMSAFDEE